MLQDSSPRVLPIRQQDLRRRGSWINWVVYCCWGSRCLQYKATVVFRGPGRLNCDSGLGKQRSSGALWDWCGLIMSPKWRVSATPTGSPSADLLAWTCSTLRSKALPESNRRCCSWYRCSPNTAAYQNYFLNSQEKHLYIFCVVFLKVFIIF